MNSSIPFNDPDVQAALKKAGVVHRPGLADEMLAEMAPLLAEEGIDLNDPDADFDLDQLNAALSYATERYNMELSTPVGDQRSRTLATLREISDAVRREDVALAERIFDAVTPDATSRRPSAAQLIGTSLELLDSWHSRDPARAMLVGFRVPQWLGRGRPAAADLLALARKGRARASLDRLMLNHGGLVLAHGGALLVAASLIDLAEHDPQDYPQVATRYLPGAPPSGQQPAAPGSAFGPAVAAAVSSQTLVKGFRRWLQDDSDDTAETVDAKATALVSMIHLVTAEGIDPHRPEEFDTVLDIVDEFYPPHQVGPAYELLHDYVDFRQETEPSAGGWNEAHDLICEVLSESDGGASAALLAAAREAEDLDDGQRRSTISNLPLISATRSLLDWIGASRPVTQAGVPRRADIGTVAAMIGVSAEGVTKQPHIDWGARAEELGGPVGERQRVYVQSAKEIPELTAWWTGLEESGVIQLTSTRVRPGPHAELLTSEGGLSLEVADELISFYVAEILTQPLGTAMDPISLPIVIQTMTRLLGALLPGSPLVGGPENGMQQLFRPRIQEELRRLEVAGLLEFTSDEPCEPVVPLALRNPVMLGVMMARAVVESEDA